MFGLFGFRRSRRRRRRARRQQRAAQQHFRAMQNRLKKLQKRYAQTPQNPALQQQINALQNQIANFRVPQSQGMRQHQGPTTLAPAAASADKAIYTTPAGQNRRGGFRKGRR